MEDCALLREGRRWGIPGSRANLKSSDPLNFAPYLSTPLGKAALIQELTGVAPESPLRVSVHDSKGLLTNLIKPHGVLLPRITLGNYNFLHLIKFPVMFQSFWWVGTLGSWPVDQLLQLAFSHLGTFWPWESYRTLLSLWFCCCLFSLFLGVFCFAFFFY